MGERDQIDKILIAYNDVFADVVNGLLFEGRQVVSPDELTDYTPYGYYKAAGKIRGQERDIAKRWNKGGVCFSCIGIENQTSPDPDMPIRIMAYDAAAYKAQLGKKEPNRHFPVITLVLYLGYTDRWDGPFHLRGCLDIAPELDPFVSDYEIRVFPVAWMTREQADRFHGDFRVLVDYYRQKRENGDYIPNPQILEHAREVMQLLSVTEKDDRFEAAYNEMIAEDYSKEGGTNMCDVLDRIENRGIAKGLEQGLERGLKQGREEGYERGRNDGYRSGQTAVLEQLAAAMHTDVESLRSMLQN